MFQCVQIHVFIVILGDSFRTFRIIAIQTDAVEMCIGRVVPHMLLYLQHLLLSIVRVIQMMYISHNAVCFNDAFRRIVVSVSYQLLKTNLILGTKDKKNTICNSEHTDRRLETSDLWASRYGLSQSPHIHPTVL